MTQTRDHERPGTREWPSEAIRLIEADANALGRHASAYFPAAARRGGIELYLKDESAIRPARSSTASRARCSSTALCNGWIREGTTIVEAS